MIPNCFTGNLYSVKKGESVTPIAEKFNVSLANLLQQNPHIHDSSHIATDQVLCIPNKGIRLPCDIPLHPAKNSKTTAKGRSVIRKFGFHIEIR
ncbi:LysM peptidoglycan-binding domain-containing protein [Priestia megaterium]|uniref:LysM peptidoglycan-binding domain-containing protein n=1 Tax=Priestia megaterium TaxID=1404 RepID=UPI00101CE39F|nr:LysM domain-containing protein [Priestia megaterium]